MKSAITIKDIAKACDCSVTTVSFVLNEKCDNIGEDTIQKIKRTVKELGYCPSISAASLKTNKSQVIGLLIPDIENDFYIKLIKQLETLLYEKSYSLMILSTNDNFEKELSAISMLKRRGIDYLILVPSVESLKEENMEKFNECLKQLPFPYIIYDRNIPFKKSSVVSNDDIFGSMQATQHFIKCGHKKIACITGPHNVSSSANRLLGYRRSLELAGIPYDSSLIYEGNYRYESGERLAREILKRKDITAIFAFNDLMAYGIYKVCAEEKLEIGKDINVIGYDDNTFSTLITPTLTSVRQDVKIIAKTIFDVIFDENTSDTEYIIKPTLVVRNSVGVIE